MGAIRVYWVAMLATVFTISTAAATLSAKLQAHASRAADDAALVVKGAVKQKIPELDEDFVAEVVIVADTADGKELGPDQGPLRLVVPGDKRQGRWVRMLRSVTVAKAGS